MTVVDPYLQSSLRYAITTEYECVNIQYVLCEISRDTICYELLTYLITFDWVTLRHIFLY